MKYQLSNEQIALKQQIAKALVADQDVAAVYLFGSKAEGRAIVDSDLDLAVLFKERLLPQEAYRRKERVFVRLDKVLRTDFDLVDLLSANLLLTSEILKNGVCLLENDTDVSRSFIAQKTVEYIDFEPVFKLCAMGMHKKAKSRMNG